MSSGVLAIGHAGFLAKAPSVDGIPLERENLWDLADEFEVPDERVYNRLPVVSPYDRSEFARPYFSVAAPPTPAGRVVPSMPGAAAASVLLAAGRELGSTPPEVPPPTLVAAPDGRRRSRRDEAVLRKPRASPLGLPPSSPAAPVAPIPPQLPPPEPPPPTLVRAQASRGDQLPHGTGRPGGSDAWPGAATVSEVGARLTPGPSAAPRPIPKPESFEDGGGTSLRFDDSPPHQDTGPLSVSSCDGRAFQADAAGPPLETEADACVPQANTAARPTDTHTEQGILQPDAPSSPNEADADGGASFADAAPVQTNADGCVFLTAAAADSPLEGDADGGALVADAACRPPEAEADGFSLQADAHAPPSETEAEVFLYQECEDCPEEQLLRWMGETDLTSRSMGSWAGDRVQKPYCHDVKEVCTDLEVRQEFSSRPALQDALRGAVARCGAAARDGRDGTVGPEPRSPPVVGRSMNIQLEAAFLTGFAVSGPSSVVMPKLHSEAVAQACTRIPWPPDGGMRPGLKAQVAESSNVEAPSVFAFLRSHFLDVDVDNDRQVDETEFVSFVVSRTKRQCGWDQVPEELEQLLHESAVRCFRQAVVRDEGLRVEDWVHFGLLLTSAPSHVAHHLLNQRLRRDLRRNPFLLKEILRAFEQADVRGAGLLTARQIEAAFVSGEAFARDMDLRPEDQVTYYDFMAYCLGYRKTEVSLNWYDVSHGFAKWVPPAVLGGQSFGGVWHTGIVVYGKEYWYGGKVLSSEPGQAPFPPGPAKTTVLGTTLRTREELEDFLRFEMAPRYTRENYDVLRRNCNHFTDEVTAFLIQGAHIPDEARFQPEVVMNAPLLEGIRPYLNHWLGGFEATGCDGQIDDLMTEWRARLWPGDLALYVPPSQLHEPMQLVRVSNVDAWRGVCDVTYFESDGPSLEPLGTSRSQQGGSSTATPGSHPDTSSPSTPRRVQCSENGGAPAVDSTTRPSSGPSARWTSWSSACSAFPLGGETTILKPVSAIGPLSEEGPCSASSSNGTCSTDTRALRLGTCINSGRFWDWQVKRRLAVPLSCLRPHTLGGRGLAGTAGAGLGHLARVSLRTSNPELQTHLRRKAIVYAHCPQGHMMRPVQPEPGPRRAWDDLMQSVLSCGICGKEIPRKTESRLQCSSCAFYLCNPCDRKGLFRGYYSLGSVDQSTSKLLLQEPAWVRYKAQRYMAAAGVGASGLLTIELWQQKVAYRLFNDLGAEPPMQTELSEMYRRFSKCRGAGKQAWGEIESLDCDKFTELLMEIFALHATVVTL